MFLRHRVKYAFKVKICWLIGEQVQKIFKSFQNKKEPFARILLYYTLCR